MPSRRGSFVVVVVVVVVPGKIDRELQVPGGTGTNRGRPLCECARPEQPGAHLLSQPTRGVFVVVVVVLVVVAQANRSATCFQTNTGLC